MRGTVRSWIAFDGAAEESAAAFAEAVVAISIVSLFRTSMASLRTLLFLSSGPDPGFAGKERALEWERKVDQSPSSGAYSSFDFSSSSR
ncbi:hypothetical protein U1Q18_045229 [Sarracenia purpurea var. burkii]